VRDSSILRNLGDHELGLAQWSGHFCCTERHADVMRNRWVLIVGALVVIAVIVIVVMMYSGGGSGGGGGY